MKDVVCSGIDIICNTLTAEGVPRPTAVNRSRIQPKAADVPLAVRPRQRAHPKGRWAGSTIRDILNNSVYIGRAVYGKRGDAIEVAVPALVTADQWQAAHDALAHRRITHVGRMAASRDPYLRRGLLTCAECGGQLSCYPSHDHRYYGCLRSHGNRAKKQKRDQCTLPMARAAGLETLAWETVTAALLDAENLRVGLEAAQTEQSQASRHRGKRLAALDGEVARLRTRLDRIEEDRLKAPRGSERERSLWAKANDADAAIVRLLAERTALEAAPVPGLSEPEAVALEEFVAEVGEGVEAAEPAERRRILQLLRVRGCVRTDPQGDTLGVTKGARHRFAVEWDAVIPLSGCNRELAIKKGRTLAVCDVDITNADGTLVAKGRVSYALRPEALHRP